MKPQNKQDKLACHYSDVLRTAIPAPSLGLLIDAFADEDCLRQPCSRSCFRQYLWTLGQDIICNYANRLETFVRIADEINAELPGKLLMQTLRDDLWEAHKQAHHAANLNEYEPDATIWVGKRNDVEIPYLQWCRETHLCYVPSLIRDLLREQSAVW